MPGYLIINSIECREDETRMFNTKPGCGVKRYKMRKEGLRSL
jgi:hypothetical protein